jgi:hypothetical protein
LIPFERITNRSACGAKLLLEAPGLLNRSLALRPEDPKVPRERQRGRPPIFPDRDGPYQAEQPANVVVVEMAQHQQFETINAIARKRLLECGGILPAVDQAGPPGTGASPPEQQRIAVADAHRGHGQLWSCRQILHPRSCRSADIILPRGRA